MQKVDKTSKQGMWGPNQDFQSVWDGEAFSIKVFSLSSETTFAVTSKLSGFSASAEVLLAIKS